MNKINLIANILENLNNFKYRQLLSDLELQKVTALYEECNLIEEKIIIINKKLESASFPDEMILLLTEIKKQYRNYSKNYNDLVNILKNVFYKYRHVEENN